MDCLIVSWIPDQITTEELPIASERGYIYTDGVGADVSSRGMEADGNNSARASLSDIDSPMAETSSLIHHDALSLPLEVTGKQSVFAVASIRVVEVVIASVALLLSLPLLLVCAIVVKASSRGPVIFTQTRVGKDGKSFKMFKLRTMRDNCERNGAVWASDEDPRVVRSCHWMRRSHIDELPQLINILKGQMALVGPRPERADILDDLESLYPNIRSRLAVRPGLTGLAQIRWGYDTTPARFRRKLSADLEYIRNRSLSLNLRIIAGTFPKFFDGSSK